MKKAEVHSFISLLARVESLHEEIGILSRKNPNDPINKFKLSAFNSILAEANAQLKDKLPLKDFDLFSEDELPTNSDVVFILGLYRKALEKVRSENISIDYSGKNWYWDVDDGKTSIRTNPPNVM
jgi:hypothetical protein